MGKGLTLIDAEDHQLKIKMRRDRIAHNITEMGRLSDQNYILEEEIKELDKCLK